MTEVPEGRPATQDARPPPREPAPSRSQWSRFRPGRTWIALFLGLLAINLFFGMRANQPAARVRIPYTPFFLEQVRAGHVKDITSKGTAIQGTFTQEVRFEGSKPTTRFKTEVPA